MGTGAWAGRQTETHHRRAGMKARQCPGRFVSADTLIPQPSNPMAWDRYAYALNNPLRYTDPSGHDVCDEDGNCYVNGRKTTVAGSLRRLPPGVPIWIGYQIGLDDFLPDNTYETGAQNRTGWINQCGQIDMYKIYKKHGGELEFSDFHKLVDGRTNANSLGILFRNTFPEGWVGKGYHVEITSTFYGGKPKSASYKWTSKDWYLLGTKSKEPYDSDALRSKVIQMLAAGHYVIISVEEDIDANGGLGQLAIVDGYSDHWILLTELNVNGNEVRYFDPWSNGIYSSTWDILSSSATLQYFELFEVIPPR